MLAKDKTINNRYLAKRSNWISFFNVCLHLALVFSPVAFVVAFPFKFHNIFFIILFGLLMNGVINLMHECAHYHVFDKRSYNIVLGQWILGPLFFANFETYRERHWHHHKFLGNSDDTKDAYLVNVHGENVLIYFLICLTGIEAIKKFFGQIKKNPGTGKSEKQSMNWILRLLLFHAVFAIVLFFLSYFFHRNIQEALTVSVYVYCIVYLYSIMSITIFTATLRAIAEHQLTSFDIIREGRASLRNFNCSVFSRIIFGSYGFGEHLTHHEYPAIPYYNLKIVTSELSSLDAKYLPQEDYLGVLYKIVTHSQSN